jgi:hypothetical protein
MFEAVLIDTCSWLYMSVNMQHSFRLPYFGLLVPRTAALTHWSLQESGTALPAVRIRLVTLAVFG